LRGSARAGAEAFLSSEVSMAGVMLGPAPGGIGARQ
jgi:hypothetical protein